MFGRYIFHAGLVTACVVLSGMAFAEEDITPSLDRGDFGPFARSLNVMPYGYRLVDDPTGSAPAKRVERFELRYEDCYFNDHWDDCDADRERSELREGGSRNARGTSAWYSWSFYVPETWPDIFPTKTVLGQFHQHRAHPIWMFLNRDGGLVLDDQSTGRTKSLIPLISAEAFKDRWHRIEVHAKWERDATGFLKIWVNDALKFDYAGPTMTADLVYFRFGIYRSFVSRYQAETGQQALPTQIAYFANVRKADTRQGLR